MKEDEILLKAQQILKKRKILWECLRCGHTWIARGIGRPARCPKCHTLDFDNPVKKEKWKCYRCGYEWIARVPNPKVCPNCHKKEIVKLEEYLKRTKKKERR